jgi:hypothetical protein
MNPEGMNLESGPIKRKRVTDRQFINKSKMAPFDRSTKTNHGASPLPESYPVVQVHHAPKLDIADSLDVSQQRHRQDGTSGMSDEKEPFLGKRQAASGKRQAASGKRCMS